jgi:hypothetical protein
MEQILGGLSQVTRFEVHGQQRSLVAYEVSVDAHLQDDGRTLKIFLSGAKKTDLAAVTADDSGSAR